MKQTKTLVKRQPKPENYQIPQTVTSPVERREIRQFIGMRLSQIKARMDRIYRFNKEQFVEAGYTRRVRALIKKPKMIELLQEYNKDNKLIAIQLDQKERITKQLERLCGKKQSISEEIEDYANKTDGLSYSAGSYGNPTDKHSKNTIETEDLFAEKEIKDQIKSDFDGKNSKQMEGRNRRIKYLNEKIEERLLFGKRDEIQKLFCELERMNTMIEKEMVNLGIENNGFVPEEGA